MRILKRGHVMNFKGAITSRGQLHIGEWIVFVGVALFLDPRCSYEVTCTKFSRHLLKELLLSVWSSIFLGFGLLFLLLWVGIYV